MTALDLRTFDAVGAMVVVLDSDDRIVHWNKVSSLVTGYALDEVRRRRPADFLLPSAEADPTATARAVPGIGDRARPFAECLITKSGDRRWIVWSSARVEEPEGRHPHVVWTGFDATDYKQLEARAATDLAPGAALASDNARLIEDALRAAADLREANQQMVAATIHAQEQTEQANAARERSEQSERELQEVAAFRERFIGILAHDLRSPLSAIALNATSLLRSPTLDEQYRDRAARIVRSSQRMTRMISQLLDLTRARLGGGIPLDSKATDLGEVCRGVVDEFGTAIDLRLEGSLTGIWDPDRLAEVISNITGNAIEHAAAGTRVVVTARAEGSDVVVEISNQGEPIPADILPFIFDAFRQGTARPHRTTSRNLGLGLYIAKQIVLAAGGALDVRSSDGKTAFVIRLPRTRSETAETRSAVSSSRGEVSATTGPSTN